MLRLDDEDGPAFAMAGPTGALAADDVTDDAARNAAGGVLPLRLIGADGSGLDRAGAERAKAELLADEDGPYWRRMHPRHALAREDMALLFGTLADDPGHIAASRLRPELIRRIDAAMGEKDGPYWDKGHPGHRAAVERVAKLHGAAAEAGLRWPGVPDDPSEEDVRKAGWSDAEGKPMLRRLLARAQDDWEDGDLPRNRAPAHGPRSAGDRGAGDRGAGDRGDAPRDGVRAVAAADDPQRPRSDALSQGVGAGGADADGGMRSQAWLKDRQGRPAGRLLADLARDPGAAAALHLPDDPKAPVELDTDFDSVVLRRGVLDRVLEVARAKPVEAAALRARLDEERRAGRLTERQASVLETLRADVAAGRSPFAAGVAPREREERAARLLGGLNERRDPDAPLYGHLDALAQGLAGIGGGIGIGAAVGRPPRGPAPAALPARRVPELSHLKREEFQHFNVKGGDKITVPTVPESAARDALAGYEKRYIEVADMAVLIEKREMTYVLQRHHPRYFAGGKTDMQSFMPASTTPRDIVQVVQSVLWANKDALKAGAKTVRAEINGVTWEVGVTPFQKRAPRENDKAAKKPPEIDRLFGHVLHVVPLP